MNSRDTREETTIPLWSRCEPWNQNGNVVVTRSFTNSLARNDDANRDTYGRQKSAYGYCPEADASSMPSINKASPPSFLLEIILHASVSSLFWLLSNANKSSVSRFALLGQ
ncbi:hypothetical protein ACLKA6_017880 [Drosophila palustris]